MMTRVRQLSSWSVLFTVLVSTSQLALAGRSVVDPPRLLGRTNNGSTITSDTKMGTTSGPLTVSDGSNTAIADFTKLSVHAVGSGSSTSYATSVAEDFLTITPLGSEVGMGSFEMYWHVTGEIISNGSLGLRSYYSPDENFAPTFFATGALSLSGARVIDEMVTLGFNDVPLNTPWTTEVLFDGRTNLSGTVAAGNSATLLGVQFFQNGVPVPSTVTGASGVTYTSINIPEPTSCALLLTCGILVALRKSRR